MRAMQELMDAGIRFVADEPMSKHTTLGIGGPADWYVEINSLSELFLLLNIQQEKKIPLFFLGGGSNLLVGDRGIRGMVVRMRGEFEAVHFNGLEVRAGAAVFLPTLVRVCADRGLYGAEPLVGVPGTVGGALVMNAGTRELEIGKIVKSVELADLDGSLRILSPKEIIFRYRSSSLKGSVIAFATLELKQGNKDDIIRKIQQFLTHRLKTQPIGTMNVGSVFKNPEGYFVAELIEKAGLKGIQKGHAQISPKHANFIVNNGGASASDVKDLILEIKRVVKEKFSVEIEPEVQMVGE